MKSQSTNTLLAVACGILEDIRRAYAYRCVEYERDRARLTQGAQTRGLAFYTLDLPSLDAVLLSLLETGAASFSGPLTRRRSKVDQRPRFLWFLWSRICAPDGRLAKDPDPNAILFLRQLSCLGKKIVSDCSPSRIAAALGEYHDIERELPEPTLGWGRDYIEEFAPSEVSFKANFPIGADSSSDQTTAHLNDVLGRLDVVSQVLVSELGWFDSLSENSRENGYFKHGPGAVADAKSRHFKYRFPHWPEKLQNVFPFDWCGSHTIDELDVPDPSEPPSKLICVPKTAKAPRLIASEPVAHQWCQQKVLTWLDFRFRSTLVGRFVDLKDQASSQSLVKSASSLRDLATLDLSSASDRVSCRAVESLLRSNRPLLEACHATRTRRVSDSISSEKRVIEIKKFAAMGSALTFPIQSLLFLCCALASAGASNRKSILKLEGKVRVYGDDIIIPVEAYATLCALLKHLGLKVNITKSFVTGEFRESCGADFFRGHCVTPVKPKSIGVDTPERCQALVDTSNNLFKKGFWCAASVLDSIAQKAGFQLPVIGPDSGVPGLVAFSGESFSHLSTKWDPNLQKAKVRMHLLNAGATRIRQDVKEALLQYFTEEPDPLRKWSSGVSKNRVATFAPRWVDADTVGYCIPPRVSASQAA